ncbi:MAG: hypothetical protein HWD85_12200 [Flavobacteriaceae bacterium]|nr:hypothetical protein [Flavobacteriaceae bacterium]
MIHSLNSTENNIIQKIPFQKKHTRLKELHQTKDSVISTLQSQGYFSLSITDSVKKNNSYVFNLNLGQKTHIAIVSYNKKHQATLEALSLHTSNSTIKIDIQHLKQTLSNIQHYYSEKGQSFTITSLKNILIKKDTLYAKLHIENKQQRVVDKIIVKGYDGFSSNYLKRYLNLNKHTIFNKDLISKISQRTNQLNFIKEIKTPEVLFSKDSTILYIYLNKQKANTFDGLINFSTENNSLQLRGYLDINLINTLNYGETLGINWKNNGNNSQLFIFKSNLPYLFKSNITANLNFQIFRQDSTFTNIATAISFQYPVNQLSRVHFIYNNEKSSTGNNDPEVTNYHKRMFGLGYSYFANQPNNFQFNINALYGKKIASNTRQALISFDLLKKIKLNNKLDWVVINKTSKLFSKNIVVNELFREGGSNSIRGFKEQSILSSAYSYLKNELRLKATGKSYLYSIHDVGYFELKNQNNILFSLGIGYQKQNSNNSIDIAYIFGRSNKQSSISNSSYISIKMLTYF